MAQSILASVGKNGNNKPGDVKIVQALLNGVAKIQGGPSTPLKVDGLCWGLTCKAIDTFQRIACNFQWPDQLIEPGGKTWNQLIVLAVDTIDTIDTIVGSNNQISGPPFWGVDTVLPADKPYGNHTTFYDYLLEKSEGRPPAFIGRYLVPSSNTHQKIDASEVYYLAQKQCKILLNYNQFRIGTVRQNGNAGRDSGISHANDAANLAQQLGVRPSVGSPSVWIYANIDAGYQPTAAWLAGWFDGIWSRGFGPGIYYKAHVGSTLVDRAVAECKIVPGAPFLWLSVWSWDTPVRSCKSGNSLRIPPYTPANPTTLGVVDTWQYAGVCFGKAFDMDLASQRGYDRMWNV